MASSTLTGATTRPTNCELGHERCKLRSTNVNNLSKMSHIIQIPGRSRRDKEPKGRSRARACANWTLTASYRRNQPAVHRQIFRSLAGDIVGK
jgi:hypothetical protein